MKTKEIVIPHLFLVEEGGHFGRFFFADADQSRAFGTKWQAKQFVYSMKEVLFDEMDVKILIEMIENTDLPEQDGALEDWYDQEAEREAKVSSNCNPEV
jgi:hypothetical protein